MEVLKLNIVFGVIISTTKPSATSIVFAVPVSTYEVSDTQVIDRTISLLLIVYALLKN